MERVVIREEKRGSVGRRLLALGVRLEAAVRSAAVALVRREVGETEVPPLARTLAGQHRVRSVEDRADDRRHLTGNEARLVVRDVVAVAPSLLRDVTAGRRVGRLPRHVREVRAAVVDARSVVAGLVGPARRVARRAVVDARAVLAGLVRSAGRVARPVVGDAHSVLAGRSVPAGRIARPIGDAHSVLAGRSVPAGRVARPVVGDARPALAGEARAARRRARSTGNALAVVADRARPALRRAVVAARRHAGLRRRVAVRVIGAFPVAGVGAGQHARVVGADRIGSALVVAVPGGAAIAAAAAAARTVDAVGGILSPATATQAENA